MGPTSWSEPEKRLSDESFCASYYGEAGDGRHGDKCVEHCRAAVYREAAGCIFGYESGHYAVHEGHGGDICGEGSEVEYCCSWADSYAVHSWPCEAVCSWGWWRGVYEEARWTGANGTHGRCLGCG